MHNSFDNETRWSQIARGLFACSLALACCTAAGRSYAQAQPQAASTGPIIYPAKGQAQPQQDKDRYECYSWARGQSGFDPAQATGQPQLAQAGQQQGNGAGGMIMGAAGGAAVAELTHHDAGRGAAMGALGAGALGKMKERQAAQPRQQQAAQQQAARSQQRAVYDRAFGACMEGRGYMVK
jgi:hypothetical protein